MQLYIYLAVATLLSTTTFVCADDTADTKAINRLTVEAATLYQQGINADNPQEAIAAFENALANLDHIVKTYPETDIAVSLATTGRIGGLHRDNIQMMLNMSRQVLEKTKGTSKNASWIVIDGESGNSLAGEKMNSAVQGDCQQGGFAFQ